jgi:hypothetical protein
MNDDDAAETAIRRYLQWLDDPTSIVDVAAIEAAEVAARRTTDVLEKLKALSLVERLRSGDEAAVKKAFVRHARAWGAANEISPTAWIRLGVPPEVLRQAGITGNRAAAQPSSRPAAGAGAATRVHAPAVTAKEIAEHVKSLSEPFVLTDIAERVGGSPMTIRKAVDQLIADGAVVRMGPVPDHDGRGRAPIRYRTT